MPIRADRPGISLMEAVVAIAIVGMTAISALESASTIQPGINPVRAPLAPAPLASENSPVLIQAL